MVKQILSDVGADGLAVPVEGEFLAVSEDAPQDTDDYQCGKQGAKPGKVLSYKGFIDDDLCDLGRQHLQKDRQDQADDGKDVAFPERKDIAC
jgi:hypothetical protein